MSEELAFPSAVVLGLWLNASLSGSVSSTDASNALETITNQVYVAGDITGSDMESSATWLEVVRLVESAKTPVAVGLPIDGDPAGLPGNVLKKIQRDSGVVAINRDLLLFMNLDDVWTLEANPNTVLHHDLNQTRRILNEQVSMSSKQLAASDLVGDDSQIIELLDEFRSLHLPPHLSKRSAESLESAAKVLIVARGAIAHTAALHSPSVDRSRLRNLEELIVKSRAVLQSVITA